MESEEEGSIIWEELPGKQIKESEFPGAVALCWTAKGEAPELQATQLTNTLQPLSTALTQAAAQRSGHSAMSGRLVLVGSGNRLAQGPAVGKRFHFSPWLSFKVVLREVPFPMIPKVGEAWCHQQNGDNAP